MNSLHFLSFSFSKYIFFLSFFLSFFIFFILSLSFFLSFVVKSFYGLSDFLLFFLSVFFACLFFWDPYCCFVPTVSHQNFSFGSQHTTNNCLLCHFCLKEQCIDTFLFCPTGWPTLRHAAFSFICQHLFPPKRGGPLCNGCALGTGSRHLSGIILSFKLRWVQAPNCFVTPAPKYYPQGRI